MQINEIKLKIELEKIYAFTGWTDSFFSEKNIRDLFLRDIKFIASSCEVV